MEIKKPLICQAGSAVEAFKDSITSGEEQFHVNTYHLYCQTVNRIGRAIAGSGLTD